MQIDPIGAFAGPGHSSVPGCASAGLAVAGHRGGRRCNGLWLRYRATGSLLTARRFQSVGSGHALALLAMSALLLFIAELLLVRWGAGDGCQVKRMLVRFCTDVHTITLGGHGLLPT